MNLSQPARLKEETIDRKSTRWFTFCGVHLAGTGARPAMKTQCCKGGGAIAARAALNRPLIIFLPKSQPANEKAVTGHPRHPRALPQTITYGEE